MTDPLTKVRALDAETEHLTAKAILESPHLVNEGWEREVQIARLLGVIRNG